MNATEFTVSALLLLISPGPTNTILAVSGATIGFRNSALMPVAGAFAYVVAISVYAFWRESLETSPLAFSIVKLIASSWLIFSAWILWRKPVSSQTLGKRDAFRRVFITTLVNPKAMIVGVMMIPAAVASETMQWIIGFALMSIVSGWLWVAIGSTMPPSIKSRSNQLAAIVLSGFAAWAVYTVTFG